MGFKSDIQIAQECEKKKITEIAKLAGVDEKYLEQYGNYKAKVDYALLKDRKDKQDGKLILVTAITPTPAGEGKTTTSVGLTDGTAQNRKERYSSSERAVPRAGIRHKGRSRRRRIRADSSDGRYKPAFYRGFPRHRSRQQSAGRHAG